LEQARLCNGHPYQVIFFKIVAVMEYKSPLDKLYEWECTQPDKVYLRQPVNDVWYSWTWKETAEEVRRMANALMAMNLAPKSHIGLISKNCAHWIICDLAIMMSGHISVPLYPNLLAAGIRQILLHSEVFVLFVGKLDDWQSMKSGVPDGVNCISLPFYPHKEYENWQDIIRKFSPLNQNIDRNPEDIATIIYTSGTTGNPKGAMHSFNNFSFAISNAIPYLGFTDHERFFSYLPLSHIAERILVEMGSLYTGGQVYFAESLEKFPENLFVARPSVFLGVPRIWKKFQERILEHMSGKRLNSLLKIPVVSGLVKKKIKRKMGLSHAVNIFTGAAPMPVELIQWFGKLGMHIQEAYAMTENCCYSHVSRNNKIKIGFVGQALPHCEVRLDNNEILVRHEAMMRGYYKDSQTTNESFTADQFFRTGDEGFIDSEGFLKITGRVKDIFKTSKGKYVSPSPIELKLSCNMDVEFICVLGAGLPQPFALVTLSDLGKRRNKRELMEEFKKTLHSINASLESHEKLAKIVILSEQWTIENGLITSSFKIKRNELEKKYRPCFEKWSDQNGNLILEN
jgi:long-chain acyl-CoA synthetase